MQIEYIEGNLAFTKDGDVWAYYEMSEYNNSFITPQQKYAISNEMERLIRECNASDFHFLQIATETDFRSVQDKCKQEIIKENNTLADFATYLIDKQTEVLVKRFGERQVRYKHYIGFRLHLTKDEVSLKESLLELKTDFCSFLGSLRHQVMDDYLVLDKRLIRRYQAMERMLYNRICTHFGFRKITPDDYGYLVEHLYGMQGVAHEEYQTYFTHTEDEKGQILVRKFDYASLPAALIHEKQRSLAIEREEGTLYVAYYTVSRIIEDLEFPSSEVLYHQQSGLSFPVDTSLTVEVVGNKEAIKEAKDVTAEMEDLIRHARKHNTEAAEEILEATETAEDLRKDLSRTKSDMYRVSFLVRVWGTTKEELQKRCIEVKDFYDDYSIKLVRPFGNMLDLHQEFLPTGKRAMNDYVQPVKAEFLSILGFGATTKLGDDYGIYMGENRLSGAPVYIRPWLAAQGDLNTKTNSLAASISGATGFGKSMFANLLLYYIAAFGNRVVILDPKSERGGWAESFPELAGQINIITLTSKEENRGMLDPFVILKDADAAENLAIDVLTYLTGISVSDGERFPYLQMAIRKVAESEHKGMLLVIEELKQGDPTARKIAGHIEGFANYGFAKLMFSDGSAAQADVQFDKALNILQVADLMLPEQGKPVEEYTSQEKLSVAAMLVIATYALEFIMSDRETYKVFAIDEAWAMLGTSQGKSLQNKCVRMGRSMNSAIYFMTQGVDDLGGKDMKNNIGMKFAFHAEDEDELCRIIRYFGMDEKSESLKKVLQGLGIGECLLLDIWGHIGTVHIDPIFQEFLNGFDTTPGKKKGA